ncbi:MAG: hypothetical protein IJS13_09755 [Paludibacteraceae bacterium]|nr:hypothetical protein [Paludibacteraceae bacterium]
MSRRSLLILFCLYLSCSGVSSATSGFAADTVAGRGLHGWFRYAGYGHSLYADEHPDFFRLDVTAMSMSPEYDYSGKSRSYSMQTLGVFGIRLPIWCGNLSDGRYGLSVTQAMSANIWMDLFESSTSPIVDTDYRISLPSITFLHRLNTGSGRFLKNYSIRFCPFNHESTHIGDEMVLQRSDKGYALRRINVSYNYLSLDLTLNEPENRHIMTHTFRLGLMLLLNPKEGWYFVEQRDGAENNIWSDQSSHIGKAGTSARNGASGLPFEMFLQYQFQSPCSKHGFQGIASAEIRNRAIYQYDLNETTVAASPRYGKADPHRFTYNIFIGARYNMPAYDGYFSRVALGIRAYHGNCPYGMFRSIDNVSHIGACLIFQ